VNPAEIDEPIKMPFGLWTRLVQRTMCWVLARITPWEGAILGGHVLPHCSSIGTQYGELYTPVGPRNYVWVGTWIPHGNGIFGGFSPLEYIVNVRAPDTAI